MSVDIIRNRFEQEKPETAEQEEYLLREILQEIALSGLSRAGLFKHGAFQGGSCLRICYGLRRFSEDLDFILKKPDRSFGWDPYQKVLLEEFGLYGIDLEISDRSRAETIRALFLKEQSLGKLLDLRHPFHPGRKLRVKLEIDVNPPAGSTFETHYLDFPATYSVLTQDLSSGFANKLHALLCRQYEKGRDWFDFTWYLARKVKPHLDLLSNALDQQGPWAGQQPRVDREWLGLALNEKIHSLDFEQVRGDVERFLGEPEIRSVEVWGQEFFLSRMEVLLGGLSGNTEY